MRAALILGSVEGLGVALLAAGLVLVYRAGRYVNFAHAQMGVISALLLGKLVLEWHINWWLAFAVSLAVGIGVGLAAEYLVIRRIRGGRIALLLGTIGLSQLLLAASLWDFLGPDPVTLTEKGYPLPFHVRVSVDALVLGTHHVLALILVPTLSIGLAVLLRRTVLGKMIRAVASNPSAAVLAGVSKTRVSAATWALAGGFSAVSAILAAPSRGTFDTEAFGPSLLLLALGASAFGGFTSIPIALMAGVGLGAFQGVVVYLSHDVGTGQLWVFIAIIVGLFVRAGAINRSTRDTVDRIEIRHVAVRIPVELRDRWIGAHSRRLVAASALFLALVAPLLPFWEDAGHRYLLALTVVFAIISVSLTVLAGWGGQVSLGQFAFVGVGAYLGARLLDGGWSILGAALVCGVAGAVIAVAVGAPALRLHGLTLAVTTLGLAVVAPSWLFRQRWFSPSTVVTIDTPSMRVVGSLSSQLAIYYLAVIVLALLIASLGALRRTRSGRLILAVRDNEVGAASFGISPAMVKIATFSLSGFIASMAGVLWLATWRTVSPDLILPQVSLVVLSLPVIGGISSLAGAVLGTVAIFGIPSLLADVLGSVFTSAIQFQLFLAGTGLVMTQIRFPDGLAGAVARQWERYLRVVARQVRERSARGGEDVAGDIPLSVHDVSVHYGGIRALDDVSLIVRPGEIVGLIGTNGAGKTTLLDAISGLVRPSGGRIVAFGSDLTRLGPEFRAHNGVARAFQDARLFPGLTVRETVQVALSRHHRTGMLASMVKAPWVRHSEQQVRRRADELIAQFGLAEYADVPTADLSTGTRRICDVAAQMASAPSLLLLDEPTAGVAQREAEAFGPMIRRIAAEAGCAVLIIEHDMPLMLGLADRIYCLEMGRVIAEGTPQEIRENPDVVASYLGTSPEAIDRSGIATSPPKKRTTAGKRSASRKPTARTQTAADRAGAS